MRRLPIVAAVFVLACTRTNPAFDGVGEASETTDASTSDPTSLSGDGDGDPSSGDGDGEPDPGDGDGEPGSESSESSESETSGDGDGDPDSGDGDGDSGDGDGEPDPGDGDGDPIDPLCDPGEWIEDAFPFETASLGFVDTSAAPGFDAAPYACHEFVICRAEQPQCDGDSPYLVKGISNGDVFAGQGNDVDPGPLQLRFWPGPLPCEEPLELDPSQYFGADYWTGQWAVIKIMLPCYEEYGAPLYIGEDGSTFWDPELTEPAALAQ